MILVPRITRTTRIWSSHLRWTIVRFRMIALLVVVSLAGVAAGPAMLSATAAGQRATSETSRGG